jgi:hypothetical protein
MLRAVAVRCCCFALLAVSVLIAAQIQDLPGATTNNSAKYSLSGTVVNSVTGEPIRRALVQISTGAQRVALTDSNGQFEFDHLAPGQTSINARKPGFFDDSELHRGAWTPPPNPPWYVQSAQCGDTDLRREELTVAAGTQTPPIEVVLRDDGATLTGRINAGSNARQATVVLVPDHGSSIRTESFVFESSAEFTFGNIAPGGYSVYAFDRIDGLEYRSPEVLDRYSSKAARVTLEPNEQHKIDLELISVEDGR